MAIQLNLNSLPDKRQMHANQLSEAPRVPQPTIFRILTGAHNSPRNATLSPLADYFGEVVSDLDEAHAAKSRGRSNV